MRRGLATSAATPAPPHPTRVRNSRRFTRWGAMAGRDSPVGILSTPSLSTKLGTTRLRRKDPGDAAPSAPAPAAIFRDGPIWPLQSQAQSRRAAVERGAARFHGVLLGDFPLAGGRGSTAMPVIRLPRPLAKPAAGVG